ncbi:MAG TPA: prepilin-type N-terminal cleavage/methylation domain-containing protein, partial [Opitutales bacterium]|nr:prepilin-type N-terminal cleavage/methylation domain-containing protein [Opitutales bacterium]
MTGPTPTRREGRCRRGYTIVELMVALTIFGLVMTGLVAFNFGTTRVLFDSVTRLDIDRDMRILSQRMLADVNTSDVFFLYRSFQSSDRINTAGTQRLGSDSSGDFILLVYSEPQPLTTSDVYITKLVGYFRRPATAGSATSFGPVFRFQIDYADQTVRADSGFFISGFLTHL